MTHHHAYWEDYPDVSKARPCFCTIAGREITGRVLQVDRTAAGQLRAFTVQATKAGEGLVGNHGARVYICRFVAADLAAGRVRVPQVAEGWQPPDGSAGDGKLRSAAAVADGGGESQ